jgi:hypothetical protein
MFSIFLAMVLIGAVVADLDGVTPPKDDNTKSNWVWHVWVVAQIMLVLGALVVILRFTLPNVTADGHMLLLVGASGRVLVSAIGGSHLSFARGR